MKKALLFSLAVLFVSLTTGCTRIGPGHAGIVINQAGSDKGVSEQTARTGWFFYNPISETVIEYQTAQRQEKWTKDEKEGKPGNTEVNFTNKDSMVIFADVAIAFSLDPAKVPAFYVKFLAKDEDDLDLKFTNGYLRNSVRNCLNDWAGQYEVKQIMGDNADFLRKTHACIQEDVQKWGVNIDQFGLIGAPRPPQTVIEAINEKSKAEQISIQKQIELEQVKADAAKRVAEADGDAKSQVARATGEAEANRLRNASVTENILKMRELDNQHDLIWQWGKPGVMPATLLIPGNSSHPLGMMFDTKK